MSANIYHSLKRHISEVFSIQTHPVPHTPLRCGVWSITVLRELLYKCILILGLNSKWTWSQHSCIKTAELPAETRWVLLQGVHHQSPEHVGKHFTSVRIRLNVNRYEAEQNDVCVRDKTSFCATACSLWLMRASHCVTPYASAPQLSFKTFYLIKNKEH
jgi:hypothetical protein